MCGKKKYALYKKKVIQIYRALCLKNAFEHDSGTCMERWGAGVETQKNVREEIGGWGRVPFNEPYAPLLSTIYDGA